jgi:hypothetical protein
MHLARKCGRTWIGPNRIEEQLLAQMAPHGDCQQIPSERELGPRFVVGVRAAGRFGRDFRPVAGEVVCGSIAYARFQYKTRIVAARHGTRLDAS